ncbi:MAG: hypothetical protein ACR2KP_01860 [Egibacteraceae bacterium]
MRRRRQSRCTRRPTLDARRAERLDLIALDYARAGRSVAELGTADELAERMLAVVPTPSPWDEIVGPVYRTAQVAAVLGGVSRQAVADRRARGRLLGLRTSDGVWVYPAFQFTGSTVLPGLTDLLGCFDGDSVDGWTLTSWLRSPRAGLDGRSVLDLLAEGDVERAVALAHDAGTRFAR